MLLLRTIGAATFYTLGQFDENGKNLDGSKTYKLKVPANVPANQFWSVTMYNMDTYAFHDDVHTVAINNLQSDLKINEDGTVDTYFSPTLPKGVHKGNWVPTKPGTEFFVLFRWYGVKNELFDGSWTMGDIHTE